MKFLTGLTILFLTGIAPSTASIMLPEPGLSSIRRSTLPGPVPTAESEVLKDIATHYELREEPKTTEEEAIDLLKDNNLGWTSVHRDLSEDDEIGAKSNIHIETHIIVTEPNTKTCFTIACYSKKTAKIYNADEIRKRLFIKNQKFLIRKLGDAFQKIKNSPKTEIHIVSRQRSQF